MAAVPTGTAQYMAKYSDQSVVCSQYALGKLGVDRSRCFLKIEEYMILCVPFQLGFKRSIFLTSLSKQEVAFFQRYVNGLVGLSLSLNPDGRPDPVKFFIHCTLSTVGQMKGRENVGLFVVDYKTTPTELVGMLGNFLENQDRIKGQYEDYGKTPIRMTPEAAKIMGYNMFASILEHGQEPRRVQIYSLSTKVLEHLEAAGGKPLRLEGAAAAYQIFFKKYRVSVTGIVTKIETLSHGIIRTSANLTLSPELVEIIDDYWFNTRVNPTLSHK
jgi:hypothetical protein